MEHKIYSKDLPYILRDMAEYADNLQEDCERDLYFNEIAGTGLFHDAIGKVVSVENRSEIIITDEY